MTMTPDSLLDNFKEQQKTAGENIRTLEQQLTQQKELYVKLQGAIEGLELLNPKEETEDAPEASAEAVATSLD